MWIDINIYEKYVHAAWNARVWKFSAGAVTVFQAKNSLKRLIQTLSEPSEKESNKRFAPFTRKGVVIFVDHSVYFLSKLSLENRCKII